MPAAGPLTVPTRIAFAGDWHMNHHWAERAIAHAAELHADVVLHLGDYGYTFDAPFMRRVDRALHRAGLPLLFVDGNHECFPYLLRYPIRANGLRQLTDHVWHLPRGLRWEWGGVRFLALGGAYSVDQKWRVPGISWWREEEITDEDEQRCVAGGPTDVLVSHDCPTGVEIPDLTANGLPAAALAAAGEHRQRLRRVVEAVRPGWIWHGHYHRDYEQVTDLGYGPVRVRGLDCDATSLDANVRVVPLAGLAGRPPATTG